MPITANSNILTDRALIRASIDDHNFKAQDGVIDVIDPAKMEAMGDDLFAYGQ